MHFHYINLIKENNPHLGHLFNLNFFCYFFFRMEEIDQLHDQKRYKEIFEITQNLVDTQGDSCPHDILWRHARAYYDLSAGNTLHYFVLCTCI